MAGYNLAAPITESIDLIREVVMRELNLSDDRVYIYNQKFTIPPVDGLMVVVAFKASKIIANRNNTRVNADDLLEEVQDLNTQEMLSVMIFSRNEEALQRKEEVVMALYSVFSQQLQEKYSFRIFRMSPIQDMSQLEGSAILYRFDIDITMMSWYQKIKKVEFYDSYRTKVRVNNGQPDEVVEFDQPITNPTS